MLLAFTTTIIDAAPLRITVQPDATNGLRLPSQAMIDHLRAMRVQRIGAIIGRLAPADMQAIGRAVARLPRLCGYAQASVGSLNLTA